jgi:hypothetical protein
MAQHGCAEAADRDGRLWAVRRLLLVSAEAVLQVSAEAVLQVSAEAVLQVSAEAVLLVSAEAARAERFIPPTTPSTVLARAH